MENHTVKCDVCDKEATFNSLKPLGRAWSSCENRNLRRNRCWSKICSSKCKAKHLKSHAKVVEKPLSEKEKRKFAVQKEIRDAKDKMLKDFGHLFHVGQMYGYKKTHAVEYRGLEDGLYWFILDVREAPKGLTKKEVKRDINASFSIPKTQEDRHKYKCDWCKLGFDTKPVTKRNKTYCNAECYEDYKARPKPPKMGRSPSLGIWNKENMTTDEWREEYGNTTRMHSRREGVISRGDVNS